MIKFHWPDHKAKEEQVTLCAECFCIIKLWYPLKLMGLGWPLGKMDRSVQGANLWLADFFLWKYTDFHENTPFVWLFSTALYAHYSEEVLSYFEGGCHISTSSCICLSFLHCTHSVHSEEVLSYFEGDHHILKSSCTVVQCTVISYFEGGQVRGGCAACPLAPSGGLGVPHHTRVNGTRDPSSICFR